MSWFRIMCLVVLNLIYYKMADGETLQQVHVLFRHGDRTPDLESLYPRDPYLNDPFYPIGLGGLTMKGISQEYNIGKNLRLTYNGFLGKTYTPDIMDAWSTEYNRTKMSLVAALAGLWPPALSQIWNPLLLWQPIPFNYVPLQYDQILRPARKYCPKYYENYKIVQQGPHMQDFLIQHANFIDYINENSGLKCNETFDLYYLYYGLITELNTGRKLPEWTKKIFPEFLEQATLMEYELSGYNIELRKAGGGPLLKKIINDARAKITGTLIPASRKIYLYSAHEHNVVTMLQILNLYKPHIPPYGAYFVIELHNINNQYGFKIFYQDYSKSYPQILKIAGCEEFCPFKKFVELTKHVVPEDNEIIC